MRRKMRLIAILAGVVGMLLGPAASQTSAQVDPQPDGIRVDAIATGLTNPPDDPDGHALGINRVSGPSTFEGLVISGAIDCVDQITGAQEVVVIPQITQPVGHVVEFFADDDITDGYGEVTPTDPTRAFRGVGALETRIPPGLDDPAPARVEIRIEGGRFHRLGPIVEVDLSLDIRVDRFPDTTQETEICEKSGVQVRIVFVLSIDEDPGTPTSGFRLVGVVTRHGIVANDRTSVARTVCGVVSPHTIRVTTTTVSPPPSVPPVPPGRDPFHPCPPEGQNG